MAQLCSAAIGELDNCRWVETPSACDAVESGLCEWRSHDVSALERALQNDSVKRIILAPGTYDLDQRLEVKRSVKIEGAPLSPSGDVQTVLKSRHQDRRVLYIEDPDYWSGETSEFSVAVELARLSIAGATGYYNVSSLLSLELLC